MWFDWLVYTSRGIQRAAALCSVSSFIVSTTAQDFISGASNEGTLDLVDFGKLEHLFGLYEESTICDRCCWEFTKNLLLSIRSQAIDMFSVSTVNPALDENSMETRAQGQRRSKREDFQTRNNGPIAPKRAALGTITNQSQRIQPFRAAKVRPSLLWWQPCRFWIFNGSLILSKT